MANHPVFRFPISEPLDRKDEYFLLQVIPTQGSKNPLDLRLLGTESTAAYEAKLRHRRAQEWKDSPGHCTEEEWEQILIATFIEPTSPHREHIEVTVDIQRNNVTLTLRRNIAGVKHRLGSIKLDEFEIVENHDGTDNGPQLFDWCVAAIGDRAKIVDDLAAASAKAVELEKSANDLKAQLEELLRAKEDDEKQPLERFRDLLNEKKLKIRQQQRLLASAEIDPARLENVGASQKTVRKAKESREGKRKVAPEADDESDDGFEKMDVDASAEVKDESGNNNSDDLDMDTRETTDEELEDATASDTQGSDDEDPPPAARGKGKGRGRSQAPAKSKAKAKSDQGRKAKVPASSRSTRAAKRKTATPPPESENQEADDKPPPRRTLPFQSKAKSKTREKSPEPAETFDNDETEIDDDEL